MLRKTLRFAGFLSIVFTLLVSSYAYAANQVEKPSSVSSEAKPGTIKTIFDKIKTAAIEGNNKINVIIAKVSKIIKNAIEVATNKDKDYVAPALEPEKSKSKLVKIVPKSFTRKVNMVQTVARNIKVAISSGDYNLMASILKTTNAEILGKAISVAINDNPEIAVPIATSAYHYLPSQQNQPILSGMTTQLSRNANNSNIVSQINEVTNNNEAANNSIKIASSFDVNQNPLPTIRESMENPSIASPNFKQ